MLVWDVPNVQKTDTHFASAICFMTRTQVRTTTLTLTVDENEGGGRILVI